MASKKFTQWSRARLAVLILMDVHAAIKSIRRGLLSRFTASGSSPRIFQVPWQLGGCEPFFYWPPSSSPRGSARAEERAEVEALDRESRELPGISSLRRYC